MKRHLLAALIAFSSGIALADVHDLGVVGKTYEIAESDLLEQINDRLQAMQSSGEIAQENQAWQRRSKEYVKRPPGHQLPRATEYLAEIFDPTIVLDKDILDGEGNILYFKGTVVNPLLYQNFTRILCFIDGDDPLQIEWSERYCPSSPEFRLILVQGNIIDIAKKLDRRVYFDQGARLINVFGIRAVPVVVRQSGEVLYVEQFPVQ